MAVAVSSSASSFNLSIHVTTGTQNSHLVPRANSEWYNLHHLWQYTRIHEGDTFPIGDRLVNTVGNGVLLRADICQLFDQAVFAFSIKEQSLCCHFLKTTPHYAELYHNYPVTSPTGVPAELMYARFAWAVIKAVLQFLSPIPTIPCPITIKSRAEAEASWAQGTDTPPISETDSMLPMYPLSRYGAVSLCMPVDEDIEGPEDNATHEDLASDNERLFFERFPT